MGDEARKRFPSRESGVPTVSQGSARKPAKQRDKGEKVTVSSPRKSAVTKHKAADGGNLKS